MIPPFSTPLNASYFASGFHSATISPSLGKLRICKPSGFAGPQPKQTFCGAYFSCSDGDFICGGRSVSAVGHRTPLQVGTLMITLRAIRDKAEAEGPRKEIAGGSAGCDRVARSRERTSQPRGRQRIMVYLALPEIPASKTRAPRTDPRWRKAASPDPS